MNDTDLADALIERLNKLVANPDTRGDIARLIESRVPCSKATLDHPTIQAQVPEKHPRAICECGAYLGLCRVCAPAEVGFLGILNGLVGVVPGKSIGYIAAVFDDNDKLERFRRTDVPKAPTST